jgi:uncharacterized transporter YbjL
MLELILAQGIVVLFATVVICIVHAILGYLDRRDSDNFFKGFLMGYVTSNVSTKKKEETT